MFKTPPSEYDAEGNSGIINIVTKSKHTEGVSGTLSTNLRQSTYFGYNNNGSLNLNVKVSALRTTCLITE